MVDENVVKDSKVNGFWAVLIVVIGLVLMAFVGWTYYNDGYNKGYIVGSMNGSIYDDGFNVGVDYGLNMSIQQMLYYAQNCSVVRINYSNNIYGFVDATCVVSLNNRS